MPEQNHSDQRQHEELSEAVNHLLDECRMVLPGIQALFGFQLIAVFNPSFKEELGQGERVLHLVAIGLVVLAIGLVMTPAAYHRQAEPRSVSRGFVDLGTHLLLSSMVLLGIGLCCDFYLVARIIIDNHTTSLLLAIALGVWLFSLWFAFPLLTRRRLKQQ